MKPGQAPNASRTGPARRAALAISVGEEDILAAVASLGDVAGSVEGDRPCQSCHIPAW
jgi:hypothetical protein